MQRGVKLKIQNKILGCESRTQLGTYDGKTVGKKSGATVPLKDANVDTSHLLISTIRSSIFPPWSRTV
jgi:hypothetical protein